MNDVFSEELLSAYLDDELSVDERSRVEHALEESGDLRRILNDLQTVSAQLQQLPRFQVGRDLSAEILRQIERNEHPSSVSKTSAQPAPKNSRRSLYWALSALAATVAIVLFASLPPQRDSVDKGPVAKGPVAQSAADGRLTEKSSVSNHVEELTDHSRNPATATNALSVDKTPRLAANSPHGKSSAADVATADTNRRTVNVAPRQATARQATARQATARQATARQAPQPQAMTLRTATPQNLKGAATVAFPPRADLKLDFSGENFAVRLAGSAKVLRSGVFDQAVKRQEISYHLTGESQPAPAFAPDHQIAKGEIDAVLVVATPPQIEDLLADLASRPDEFYSLAAYPIKYNSLLLWLAYLADSSSRTSPGGEQELSGEKTPDRSLDAIAFFQNRTKNGFAWRTPQLTQDEIEGFFPAPKPVKKAAAAAEKKAGSVVKKVDLTKKVRVLFFLQATTAEQPEQP